MKKFLAVILSLVFVFCFAGCEKPDGTGGDDTGNSYIYVSDYHLKVDEAQGLSVQSDLSDLSAVTYTVKESDKENIVIYGNSVYGLKGGTTSEVTAKLGSLEHKFTVDVAGTRLSQDKYTGADFNEVSIEPVQGLNERGDFIAGADISSFAEIIKNKGQFYDAEGYPVSLLLQLKNSGINYIRVRLWNKPVSPSGKAYGGGNNDIETAKKIAAPAKALGLKFLLCVHYSDFWADPGKQVIPQEWLSITDSDSMAAAVKDFTVNAVNELKSAGAEPDIIQIGNEITNGMLYQTTSNLENIKNSALYTSAASSISGTFSNSNFIKYLKAGISGAKEAAPSIKIMIHIDRGANNARCRTFYDKLAENNVEYDIIGLSYYSFYHGAVANFAANVEDLSVRYGKKIVVAETSYAFTNKQNSNLSSIFSSSSGNKAYAVSPQGQTDKLRAVTDALVKLDNNNGLGIFYWEPAWLPVSGAGWADAGTLGTWADQALFSYDGVALPSLNTFNLLRGI